MLTGIRSLQPPGVPPLRDRPTPSYRSADLLERRRGGSLPARPDAARSALVRLGAGVLVLLVTLSACTAGPNWVRRNGQGPPAVLAPPAYRAFTDDSWWNSPVPAEAPSNPRADAILDYLRTAKEAGDGCLRLAGTSGNNWGQPVYWSKPGDPEYDVAVRIPDEPPELHSL